MKCEKQTELSKLPNNLEREMPGELKIFREFYFNLKKSGDRDGKMPKTSIAKP